MPPQQGSRYSVQGRRPFIGDAWFESRANIILEPSTKAVLAGRLYENAYQGAVDAFTLAGSLWVPTPLDGANAELTYAVGTPTPNVTTVGEQLITANQVVSGWLSRGTRFVCLDPSSGSAVVKYGIVTHVAGAAFALLTPKGQADILAITQGSTFFSNAAHPHGFDLDPITWAAQYTSGASDIGVGNSSAWTTAPGPPAVRLPAGCWALDFTSPVEYGVLPADPVNAGSIAIQVGLSTVADTEPDGDLIFDAFDTHQGDRPQNRTTARASADRTLPYTGGSKLFALTFRNGGASKMHMRNDIRPTIVRARCTLL